MVSITTIGTGGACPNLVVRGRRNRERKRERGGWGERERERERERGGKKNQREERTRHTSFDSVLIEPDSFQFLKSLF